MRERVVFHADMDAFFASVEQRYNPALRGRPIVVCGNGGGPDRDTLRSRVSRSRTASVRSVVAACSYEAKAFGIKNGMSAHEARALCPGVLLVGGNPEKYVDISQRIFAVLAEFSPETEIFSIDEAFLEMTGTWPFFGPEPEEAARLIKRRVREQEGLTCSVGIGPNKLIAKLASGLRKPDGLVRVRAAEVPALLERLPVEELCGIGERMETHLNGLGVVTCGDLGRVAEEVLVERFGVVGRMLKRMGQGLDDSPVLPLHAEEPVKSMGHCYTLPRNTWDDAEVRGTLLRLSEQVARRLRQGGYQGRTVGLTLRYADFTTISHQRTGPTATDAGFEIYRRAMGLLGRYGEAVRQPVRLVGVGVSNLIHGEREMGLLEEEERLTQLDRCVDRVSDRFGEFTVTRAGALAPLVRKSHGFIKPGGGRQGWILR